LSSRKTARINKGNLTGNQKPWLLGTRKTLKRDGPFIGTEGPQKKKEKPLWEGNRGPWTRGIERTLSALPFQLKNASRGRDRRGRTEIKKKPALIGRSRGRVSDWLDGKILLPIEVTSSSFTAKAYPS